MRILAMKLRISVITTKRAYEDLEQHGMIKCTKANYKEIDPSDIVSTRLTDFGAEVMVKE